ncbi:MAG: RNA methyltransferase [Deltaproteobacteria bacterium]|jgi:tRNA G18 (ribose-2'-O)-methylase SpoU|nr:RNA methyltransferase [Deltaproteobacteria bacterium]
MIEIKSAQNPRYKTWLKLSDGRGIKKHAQALVAGRKFIEEILAFFPERVQGVLAARPELELNLPANCPVYLLSAPLFATLDIYGIKEPVLLVSAPPPEAWPGGRMEQPLAETRGQYSQQTPAQSGLTVFIPFQNPINLGTTIRSAAAFGATAVLLREAATPYLPKALRASGPAIFQIPLYQGPSLAELAKLDLPIYALSPRGKNIFSFAFPPDAGLVAGLEGSGLDAYWPEEKRLSIPMRGQVESLNAAVAMSIAMACCRMRLY